MRTTFIFPLVFSALQPSLALAAFQAMPAGFRWCVATSAHQIEGGNTASDWWQWEHQAGKIKNAEISGASTDHWNRLEADTELLLDLGVQQYRFSVEWAKIEPQEGVINPDAIAHYRKEIQLLKKAGITPLLTLHHFTLPTWVTQKGSWEWSGFPAAFEHYAQVVVDQIGAPESVVDWLTFNEPMVVLLIGYTQGTFPPGEKREMGALGPLAAQLVRAHARAYRVIHTYGAQAGVAVRVGLAHNLRIFDPKSKFNPLDIAGAKAFDQAYNWSLSTSLETGKLKLNVPFVINYEADIPEAAHTQDFLGVNYYGRDRLHVNPFHQGLVELAPTEGAPQSDLGWEIYPEGMYRILKAAAGHFPGKSILITENGIADAKDEKRGQFIHDHLAQVHRAIAAGVPVEGYCHWSFLDNFEWAEGFWPRFGLYEVDYATFGRKLRPSGEQFRTIIQQNGFLE